ETKIFCHLERAVVRQHHATATYPDAARMRRNLAHQDLRAGAGKVGHIMMLRHPVALVAHGLCSHGQRNGFPQGISRRAPFTYRRLTGNTQVKRLLHFSSPLPRSPLWAYPRLGPRQTGRATVLVTPFLRERLAHRHALIERYLGAARWDEAAIYPMWPA